MIESCGSGICDRCDEHCSELYHYKNVWELCTYEYCEECYPKCECGSMEIEDGTDYCEQCNAVIELEEKA